MNEKRPAVVFHPGEHLLDELDARGWTQVEFAEIIGRSYRLVNEIVNGKRGITPDTAKAFGAAFDTGPEYWMNLESAYNLWKSQREDNGSQIKLRAKMSSIYPVRDMILRKWLEASEDTSVLENQILRFFEIPSLESTPRLIERAAYRRANYKDEEINPIQVAWLYRVKHIADSMVIPKYSVKKLKEVIEDLKKLRGQAEQVRHIPSILEQCGVRFVVVEPFSSSKIDGVCFWLENSPVIGMTLRYDRIDNFWFVLIHEIEHVLNGDGKDYAIIDSDIMEISNNETLSMREKRANIAAAEFCTPQSQLDKFIYRKGDYISKKDFLDFAMSLGIHCGIVAGQLRKKTGRWELFNYMNDTIREQITPVSMTDGYGQVLPVQI